MIIENARIGLCKGFNVIWANIEDQDSDVIIKLWRWRIVNDNLLYEHNDHMIYLSTYSHKENNVLVDILNSRFAQGFGQGIGEILPDIIDSITRYIGKEKTEQLIKKLEE